MTYRYSNKATGITDDVHITTHYSGMKHFVTSNMATIVIPYTSLSKWIENTSRKIDGYSLIVDYCKEGILMDEQLLEQFRTSDKVLNVIQLADDTVIFRAIRGDNLWHEYAYTPDDPLLFREFRRGDDFHDQEISKMTLAEYFNMLDIRGKVTEDENGNE